VEKTDIRIAISPERRIAISELLSIAMLPLGRTPLDGMPEIPSDLLSNIVQRVMTLLHGDHQHEPWEMSDTSILDCLLELQRRKMK